MIKRCFFVFLLLCGFSSIAHAQFVIEQGKIVVSVSPGQRINDSIMIHNSTDQEQDVRVYWEDFEYVAPFDGTKNFMPAGVAKDSASKWISFQPQEFRIAPFGKQKIEYSLNIPQDIQGGHYGVLFFEKSSKDLGKDATGMTIVIRMGSLFFIEAKDGKNKQAALENIKVADGKITADFMNQGNVVLIPNSTYYIMDQDGLVADRGDVKKLYTPPGGIAPFEIVLPGTLKAGTYTLVINSDLEEGDVVVREIELMKDAAGKITLGAAGK